MDILIFNSSNKFVHYVLALPTLDEQQQFLLEHAFRVDDEVLETIKQTIEDALRSNIECAMRRAELLAFAATCSKNDCHRALALLAKGNIRNFGLADYDGAIHIYNDALKIYKEHGDLFGEARVKLGRLWALSWLGRHIDAFADGECCLQTFRDQQKWKLLATTQINLSQVHVYNGNDELALTLLAQATTTIQQHAPQHKDLLTWIEQNVAISLRNTGRFEASIQASLSARKRLEAMGYLIEAARAQQNLAVTYYLTGRYNEALTNLEEAYTVFATDQRWANAMVVELSMTDCLLQLRRFQEVIEICWRIRRRFQDLNVDYVVGEIIINQAAAYTQLGEYTSATNALDEAFLIFQQLNNPIWLASVQLDKAFLCQCVADFQSSIQLAIESAHVFSTHHHPIKEADAWLAAATSALLCNEVSQTQQWIERALQIGTETSTPLTIFQSQRLLGMLLERKGNDEQALQCYEIAIVELEKLRNTLMLEHSAAFLSDKNAIYEVTVDLCLASGDIQRALQYTERAKSRALVDLLDRHLDLKIRARRSGDEALVEELHQLMQQRDQLQNRVTNAHMSTVRAAVIDASPIDTLQRYNDQLKVMETQITSAWHKLLSHNADYAREASLVRVDCEMFQRYIPKDVVLIEYFVVKGYLLVFCVNDESVTACRLPGTWHEIQILLQKWQLNLQAVMRNPLQHATKLLTNAQGILQQLEQKLLAPVSEHLQGKRLVIVPHSSLHYAPFHAFYNGQTYLLERHEVSYLPAAGLLRFVQSTEPKHDKALVYGNTQQMNLSHIMHEVKAVAGSLAVPTLLDNDLDKSELIKAMEDADIIHLATHGEFHPHNPLFSGLQLQDGWLTTLDVFNLQLNASLVTLSACNTGRHHILGGDEVAGLIRAFLSAGAKSLVLSLWSVEDKVTASLMTQFYQRLRQGFTKSASLREAQLDCIYGRILSQNESALRSHPFFWAPFFLVGDS